MYLEIEENPNCEGQPLQAFQTLSPARPVCQMRVTRGSEELFCWVTGVEAGGTFCPARAQKVSDSGGGVSVLIYGGSWGLRVKPVEHPEAPWDFSDPRQWGEPFKFYGNEKDLVYSDAGSVS